MDKGMDEKTGTENRAKKKAVVIGITGASGIIYGLRAVESLSLMGYPVFALITRGALKVAERENSMDLFKEVSKHTRNVFMEEEIDAPTSSSSFLVNSKGMAVIPCSIRTLAEVAHGIASNLVTRTAINFIRMRKRLTLVLRETPLGPLELENALKLSRMGVVILPASPGFYSRPKTIEDIINFVVGKTLDSLGIENDLYKRWSR